MVQKQPDGLLLTKAFKNMNICIAIFLKKQMGPFLFFFET